MTSSKHPSLYFLALIPPEPYFSEVIALKQEVAAKFGSKAALNSPPHVTLHMPFRLQEKKQDELELVLEEFANNRKKVEIVQNGFGAFAPRVIYVNVALDDSIRTLQKELLKMMRISLKTESTNYKNQAYRPHMTFAFRDLKKNRFEEAWSHFKDRPISFHWTATDINLLKHNGQSWDIFRSFPLR